MTTTNWAAAANPPQLSIGRVVGGTFRTVSARIAPLLILAIPFVFVPQVLTGFLPKDLERASLLANLPGFIFDGAAVLITYRFLTDGGGASAGEAMREAMGRFGAIWGMNILAGLGMLLGLVLLIVPGIYVGVSWMVALPVLMIEKARVTDSLQRSWRLSQGQRWRLAGLLGIMIGGGLLALLLMMIPMIVIGVVSGEGAVDPLTDFLLSPLFVTVVSIFLAVGSAATYVELRRAVEGVAGGGEIAEVFS
jgi:hypothetical protein